MKVFIVLLFTSIGLTNAFGQTKISGNITDKKGNAIIGANVYLRDTYDGSSSNLNGSFEFVTEEKGSHTLLVTSIGYKSYETDLKIEGINPITLTVTLHEEINKLDAVVISAGSFNAGEETKREVLKPLDIVTTAGSSADIAGALNTLPGTQVVGEEGRLFVRGGSGHETKTYIDGMQVLNAYSSNIPNTPSRGRFSPFMFKGTSFSTGGYSAEYGQALSSALILNSKDIPTKNRGDISIMSVGLDASLTHVCKRSSFSGKVQYTNIAPYFNLIKQSLETEKSPTALDGNFVFRQKVRENGMLKFYGNMNQSHVITLLPDIDDTSNKTRYDLINNYYYFNTSYKDVLNDKWSVKTGFAYTFSRDNIGIDLDKVKETQGGYHSKFVFSNDISEKLALNFGAEVYRRNYKQTYTATATESTDNFTFDEDIIAGFAEVDLYTSNNFVTKAGARWEYLSLPDEWNISPRISFGYKTGTSSQISLAYGKFQQSPESSLLKVSNRLSPERADHYILNYQLVTDKKTFRIELYQKDYKNLVKFDKNDLYNPLVYQNSGQGYARGIDVFWRDSKTFHNVDYWISYSYLDTKRDFKTYPFEATPHFASKHNFSVVYKHFITDIKTQVGVTFSYGSGRPYHNPNEVGFNAKRTRSYQDLSANISYLWKSNVILHTFVSNVLGRENIFGYEYSDQLNETGSYNHRAIKPTAPRFIFLGVFITLSKDKTLNELPNL